MGYAGMKFKPRTFQSTFLAVLLAWAVGGMNIAHADVSEKAEVDSVHRATTSPVGAVSRAEAKFCGRAFDMGLEVSTSGTWYEVPLNVRGKPMLARINPSSGAWLGMSPAHGEDVQGLHVGVAAQRAGLGRAKGWPPRSRHDGVLRYRRDTHERFHGKPRSQSELRCGKRRTGQRSRLTEILPFVISRVAFAIITLLPAAE